MGYVPQVTLTVAVATGSSMISIHGVGYGERGIAIAVGRAEVGTTSCLSSSASSSRCLDADDLTRRLGVGGGIDTAARVELVRRCGRKGGYLYC